MILVVDGGSTKCSWLLAEGDFVLRLQTSGINPVIQSEDLIGDILCRELKEQLLQQKVDLSAVSHVYYYGAGCMIPYDRVVHDLLQACFPAASISVASDLLGVARALCQHDAGIACILGTGSNSCLYDGRDIVGHVPALGYILGDEGSGAYLGKVFLNALLKGGIPESLVHEFHQFCPDRMEQIVERVYRQPFPSRYLASFSPFIYTHRHCAEIHNLLLEAFSAFFEKNVMRYHRTDLSVSFCGSIAYFFQEELADVCQQYGCVLGNIIKNPVDKFLLFHQNTSNL